jgi:hypothetical protein
MAGQQELVEASAVTVFAPSEKLRLFDADGLRLIQEKYLRSGGSVFVGCSVLPL